MTENKHHDISSDNPRQPMPDNASGVLSQRSGIIHGHTIPDGSGKELPVLLFDLGGVIMDIKKENCMESLRRLGMKHPEDFLGDYGQKGPFLGLEEGSISPARFREELREYLDPEVTDEEIDDAFNDFLTGIPVERLRRLGELHRTHRIFMLSNTNPIMWDSKIAAEFRKDGHDRDYYFDGCLTSFEAGCCKPDDRIFLQALEKFGLRARDVLFLDDSRDNCIAAAKLGFMTATVSPGKEFYEIIREDPTRRRNSA